MVTLRRFTRDDAGILREKQAPDMTEDGLAALIDEYNVGSWRGKRFEMLAVVSDGDVVGSVSLLEHSRSVVSLGPEIFPAERRKGYAGEAMRLALARAAELGFRIVLQQILTDNEASLRLHEKLGFESDGYRYRNAKDREVVLYLKAL